VASIISNTVVGFSSPHPASARVWTGDLPDGGSDMVAAQGEVYVQFWLKVGEAPVEVSLDEKGQEEMIPAVLKQYL
jgi:hypothetical protein